MTTTKLDQQNYLDAIRAGEFDGEEVMTCNICKKTMDVPGEPETKNCGGDCAKCMADAGDPNEILFIAVANRLKTERVVLMFISKTNRDAEARAWRVYGFETRRFHEVDVKRHPSEVFDAAEHGIDTETGKGEKAYAARWKVLYGLEVWRGGK